MAVNVQKERKAAKLLKDKEGKIHRIAGIEQYIVKKDVANKALGISPERQALAKSNKKVSESECFVILDRLDADRSLTLTVIAKEYGISHQYLSQQLAPVREKRIALRDKLFGERLKGMMTTRLDTHDQLNNILQTMLAEVETELSKSRLPKARKEWLNKERTNLVYRIGSNWIALSNTLKPLGVTVSSGDHTPNNISPVNILQIFVKKDGKPVESGEAEAIAAKELAELVAYGKEMEDLGGENKVEEAEFEEVE